MWDVDKGAEFRTFPVLDNLSSFRFSPDNARLAATKNSGVVKTWDLATGQELWNTKLQKGSIRFLSFSQDGKRLAAPCSGGEVRILDAASGREVSPPLKSLAHRIRIQPRWQPPGHDHLFWWDRETLGPHDGEETLTLKGHDKVVSGLSFSPDGHRLISASMDMTVRIWDATPLPE